VLKTRVLAALIFAPALLLVVIKGGLPLQLTCLALSLVMLWEAMALLVPPEAFWVRRAAWLLGAATAAWSVGLAPSAGGHLILGTGAVVLLAAALASPGALGTQVSAATGALLSIALTAGLMPLLWQLRARPVLGLGLSLMALFCTWASDTGAYFAGRAFGRRKLYPRISPGKTLEGALGGLALGMAMAMALAFALKLPLALGEALTLGLLAATLGILGDLSESLLKRQAGVKDSSKLIPGHGGFLDRFDGVLFALYGVEAYTTWVLGL
jgi:phosphatidate cytidylyltransferase